MNTENREYYSTIENNKVWPFIAIWIDRQHYIKWDKLSKTNTACSHTHVEGKSWFHRVVIPSAWKEKVEAARRRLGSTWVYWIEGVIFFHLYFYFVSFILYFKNAFKWNRMTSSYPLLFLPPVDFQCSR